MSGVAESILQLNDFRVMKSYFEVHEAGKRVDSPILNISLEVALLQSDDAEDDMAVQVSATVNGDEEQFEAAGFTGSLIVTGFFTVAELRAQRPDDWEPALVYNGVMVLFGTVRTLFADLSAASPVGRIVLPAISPADLLDRAASAEDGEPGSPAE
jgi:preprotein translocase subunit SecB